VERSSKVHCQFFLCIDMHGKNIVAITILYHPFCEIFSKMFIQQGVRKHSKFYFFIGSIVVRASISVDWI